MTRDVGKNGLAEVLNLCHWVHKDGPADASAFVARYAPSVVTRGEVEILGISMPRFALRVYLTDDQTSFVNCRRLRQLLARVPKTWSSRIADPGRRIPGLEPDDAPRREWRTPRALVMSSSCIADSMLGVPPDYGKGYHIIYADLASHYGEPQTGKNKRHTRVTPYVKSLPLAGMCAQSVCFMATALLCEQTSHLFCMAEISALATSSDVDELIIAGLTRNQIVAFFERRDVGLRAFAQKPVSPHCRPEDGSDTWLFTKALQWYALSDMPVILPTDMGRLAGHGSDEHPVANVPVYSKNEIKGVEGPKEEHRPRHHAVLVVGCETGKEALNFLLHDPSYGPYLRASGSDIATAGCYCGPPEAPMSAVDRHVFLPVTPRAVKLALLRGLDQDASQATGLLDITQMLQGPRLLPRKEWRKLPDVALRSWPGEMRLGRLGDVRSLARSVCGKKAYALLKQEIPDFKSRLTEEESGRWCWVQGIGDSLWVWDAQAPPPRFGTPQDAFSRLIYTTGRARPSLRQSCLHRFRRARDPHAKPALVSLEGPALDTSLRLHDNPPRPTGRKRRVYTQPPGGQLELRPSLITSFTVMGVRDAMANWPRDHEGLGIELYGFMQKDAEKYLLDPLGLRSPKGLGTRGFTALELMAMAWRSQDRDDIVKSVADAVMADIRDSGIQPNVVAVASFLPEISSRNDESRGMARDALVFLLELSACLNDVHSQRIRVVELVGGSRIAGAWPGIDTTRNAPGEAHKVFVANWERTETTQKRLMDELKVVAVHADRLGLSLGLELEPSKLCVIRDLQSYRDLLSIHRGDSSGGAELGRRVGLNVDIGHFSCLAGISAAELRYDEVLWPRILHGHISDHGAAHCDLPIGTRHSNKYFKPFLHLLAERGRHCLNGQGMADFSGHVSVELEACRDNALVAACVKDLVKLLPHGGTQ
jgi:hypothetical protein